MVYNQQPEGLEKTFNEVMFVVHDDDVSRVTYNVNGKNRYRNTSNRLI